jgi:hypothetical protein
MYEICEVHLRVQETLCFIRHLQIERVQNKQLCHEFMDRKDNGQCVSFAALSWPSLYIACMPTIFHLLSILDNTRQSSFDMDYGVSCMDSIS